MKLACAPSAPLTVPPLTVTVAVAVAVAVAERVATALPRNVMSPPVPPLLPKADAPSARNRSKVLALALVEASSWNTMCPRSRGADAAQSDLVKR